MRRRRWLHSRTVGLASLIVVKRDLLAKRQELRSLWQAFGRSVEGSEGTVGRDSQIGKWAECDFWGIDSIDCRKYITCNIQNLHASKRYRPPFGNRRQLSERRQRDSSSLLARSCLLCRNVVVVLASGCYRHCSYTGAGAPHDVDTHS